MRIEYKKEYSDALINHMKKGYSFGTFCTEINVSPQLLKDWLKRHPDFKQAALRGHEEAKKYFETLAVYKIRGLDTVNFVAKRADTALLIFFLKTRFRDEYSERFEVDHNTTEGKILQLSYVLKKETKTKNKKGKDEEED